MSHLLIDRTGRTLSQSLRAFGAARSAPWPPCAVCTLWKWAHQDPSMQQTRRSINARVHFIWHPMHYLVTFPSQGLLRSHPSLENSNGTACYDTMHPTTTTTTNTTTHTHICTLTRMHTAAAETLLAICALLYHAKKKKTPRTHCNARALTIAPSRLSRRQHL